MAETLDAKLPSAKKRGLRSFRFGLSSKQDFILLDGHLFGPALPDDAAAVRVVRVGGGSTLRRLGRSFGRREGHARELDAMPTTNLASQQSQSVSRGGMLASWAGPVLLVSKTIHGARYKEALVNLQLQYTTNTTDTNIHEEGEPSAQVQEAATTLSDSHSMAVARLLPSPPPPQPSTPHQQQMEWRVMPGVTTDACLDLARYIGSVEGAPTSSVDLTWPFDARSNAGSGRDFASTFILKASVVHVTSECCRDSGMRRFLRLRSGLRLTSSGLALESDSGLAGGTGSFRSRSHSHGLSQLPPRADSARSDVTSASLPPLETEYPSLEETLQFEAQGSPPPQPSPSSPPTPPHAVRVFTVETPACETADSVEDVDGVGIAVSGGVVESVNDIDGGGGGGGDGDGEAAAGLDHEAEGGRGESHVITYRNAIPNQALEAGSDSLQVQTAMGSTSNRDSDLEIQMAREVEAAVAEPAADEGRDDTQSTPASASAPPPPPAPAPGPLLTLAPPKVSPDVMLKALQHLSQPTPLPPGHAAAPHPAATAAAEAVAAMTAAATIAASKLKSTSCLPLGALAAPPSGTAIPTEAPTEYAPVLPVLLRPSPDAAVDDMAAAVATEEEEAEESAEVDVEIVPGDHPIVDSLEMHSGSRVRAADFAAGSAVEALEAARQAAAMLLVLPGLRRSASGSLGRASCAKAALRAQRLSPHSSGSASAPSNEFDRQWGSAADRHVADDLCGSIFHDLASRPVSGAGNTASDAVIGASDGGYQHSSSTANGDAALSGTGFFAGGEGLWVLNGTGRQGGAVPRPFLHVVHVQASEQTAATMGSEGFESHGNSGDSGGDGGGFASGFGANADSGVGSKSGGGSAVPGGSDSAGVDGGTGSSGGIFVGGEPATWVMRGEYRSGTDSVSNTRDAGSQYGLVSDLAIKPSGEITGVLDLQLTAAAAAAVAVESEVELQPQPLAPLLPPPLRDLFKTGVPFARSIASPTASNNSSTLFGLVPDGAGAVARDDVEEMGSAASPSSPELIPRLTAIKVEVRPDAAATRELLVSSSVQPSAALTMVATEVVSKATGLGDSDNVQGATEVSEGNNIVNGAGDCNSQTILTRSFSEPLATIKRSTVAQANVTKGATAVAAPNESAADSQMMMRMSSLPLPGPARVRVARLQKPVRRQSHPATRPVTVLEPVPEGSESKEDIGTLPAHFFSPLSSPTCDDADCATAFFSEPGFIYGSASLVEPDVAGGTPQGGSRDVVVSELEQPFHQRHNLQKKQQPHPRSLRHEPQGGDGMSAAAVIPPAAANGTRAASGGPAASKSTEAEHLLRHTLLPAALNHTDQWVAAHRCVPIRDMAVLRDQYKGVEVVGLTEAAAEPVPEWRAGTSSAAVEAEADWSRYDNEAEDTAAQAGSSRESEEEAEAELDELLAEGVALVVSGELAHVSGMGEEEEAAGERGEEKEQEEGGHGQVSVDRLRPDFCMGPMAPREAVIGGNRQEGPAGEADEGVDGDAHAGVGGGGEGIGGSGAVTPIPVEVPWSALKAEENLQSLRDVHIHTGGMALTSGSLHDLGTDPRVSDILSSLPNVMDGGPNPALGLHAEISVPEDLDLDLDPAVQSSDSGAPSRSALHISELEAVPQLEPLTIQPNVAAGSSYGGGGASTNYPPAATDESTEQVLEADVGMLLSQRASSLEVRPGRALSSGAQLAAPHSSPDHTMVTRRASAIPREPPQGGAGGLEATQQVQPAGGGSDVPVLSPEAASVLAVAVLQTGEGNVGNTEAADAFAPLQWPQGRRQRRRSVRGESWLGWWPVVQVEKALVVGAASTASIAAELCQGVSHGRPPVPYGPDEGMVAVPLLRPHATMWAHLPWPLAPLTHACGSVLVALMCGALVAVDKARGALGWPPLISVP